MELHQCIHDLSIVVFQSEKVYISDQDAIEGCKNTVTHAKEYSLPRVCTACTAFPSELRLVDFIIKVTLLCMVNRTVALDAK